jgi:hypothetical protein
MGYAEDRAKVLAAGALKNERFETSLQVWKDPDSGQEYSVSGIVMEWPNKPTPYDVTGNFIIQRGIGAGINKYFSIIPSSAGDSILAAFYDGPSQLVANVFGYITEKVNGRWVADKDQFGRFVPHLLVITISAEGLHLSGDAFDDIHLQLTAKQILPDRKPFTFFRGADGKPVAMQVGDTNN